MANGDTAAASESGATNPSTANGPPKQPDEVGGSNGQDSEGHLSQLSEEEELVQTPYLPDRIELPADKSQVLQHLELMFALSVKVPEFLEK